MQRRSTNRGTHVLAFGLPFDQWFEWKGTLKGGLQSFHMGWSLTSGQATTVDEAVQHIKAREDLEIICFIYDRPPESVQMIEDAKAIARALAEHKHKPWVAFGPELNYLKPVFEREGIRVNQRMLEIAIFERWEAQIADEISA